MIDDEEGYFARRRNSPACTVRVLRWALSNCSFEAVRTPAGFPLTRNTLVFPSSGIPRQLYTRLVPGLGVIEGGCAAWIALGASWGAKLCGHLRA